MNKKAGTLAKNFELGGEIVFVWFVKGQRSSKISSKVSVHDDSDNYAFVRTKVCTNAHHKPDAAFPRFLTAFLDIWTLSSSTFELMKIGNQSTRNVFLRAKIQPSLRSLFSHSSERFDPIKILICLLWVYAFLEASFCNPPLSCHFYLPLGRTYNYPFSVPLGGSFLQFSEIS